MFIIYSEVKGAHFKMEVIMNDNTKIELAREIMNAMIGRACKNGFNPNDVTIQFLLYEEREMEKFNFDIIDKIIEIYGPMVNAINGGQI